MRIKLFYLVGVVFLLWSTGTFTSCVNGVDDEYLELIDSGKGEPNPGDEVQLPDLNGNYEQGGDFELKMIYNGEELSGKRVNVAADELNETATITLSGVDKDLSELVGGLLEFKFETFSPVPGIKEIVLPNVTLYNSKGMDYRFTGELIQPTYTLNYAGTIKDGKMEININHQLVNHKLAGTWDLAPTSIKHGNKTQLYSPLWFDWDSRVKVNLGKVSIAKIDAEMNGVFALLTGALSPFIMNQIIGEKINTMDLIRNMLKGITAQPNGSIFATYSYSGDVKNPVWSSEMPRNAIRYYYDPEKPDSRLFLEVNPDMIVSLVNGLMNPTKSTRAADPEVTKQLGRQLIALLTPVLQKGIPCDYVLDGSNLSVNIDGVVLRNILRKLFELANDEVARPEVEKFLNENLGGDVTPAIMNLIRLAPYTLKYHDATTYDPTTNVPLGLTGECAYVKLGLKFVKVN